MPKHTPLFSQSECVVVKLHACLCYLCDTFKNSALVMASKEHKNDSAKCSELVITVLEIPVFTEKLPTAN